MSRRLAPTFGLFAILVLACGGGSPSTAPAVSNAPAVSSAPAASAPETSAAASTGGGGGGACTASTGTPTVPVTIQNFAFGPAAITAKVGDVVGFTNKDSVNHTATLDDGSCTTDSLSNGATGALTFTAAGTYPFHCKIHPTMKGTITVS
jgi:plastocyanin